MPDIDSEASQRRPTVFVSYASQDRDAARLLRETLSAHGLDPWFDESGLGGGDEWDRKIRRQIRDCDYFMPLISAQTEARHEGYFRREWRLAVERTLDMADDHAFLLPVVIDDTSQAHARVPEKFLTVQWLKVPGGEPTSAFTSMLDRVVQGTLRGSAESREPAQRPRAAKPGHEPLPFPSFPEAPTQGQRGYWRHVGGWVAQCLWLCWQRIPRWIRLVVVIWAVIAFMTKLTSTSNEPEPHRVSTAMTPAKLAKLRTISEKYKDASDPNAIAALAAAMAREFADGSAENSHPPLLAVAFTAPPGDIDAEKFANTAFALTYAKLSLAHKGLVGLAKEPQTTKDAAVERARGTRSSYVLFGTVAATDGKLRLDTAIIKVEDGSTVWTKSYEAATDTDKIAAEVDAHVPALDDE